MLSVEQCPATLEALDVFANADEGGVLVRLEVNVGLGQYLAEVADLGGNLLGALLLSSVAIRPALLAVGFVLGYRGPTQPQPQPQLRNAGSWPFGSCHRMG